MGCMGSRIERSVAAWVARTRQWQIAVAFKLLLQDWQSFEGTGTRRYQICNLGSRPFAATRDIRGT